MTDEEFEVLREEIADMQERIRADLAAATGRAPSDFETPVAPSDLPDPDDLETVPAEEFYDDH